MCSLSPFTGSGRQNAPSENQTTAEQENMHDYAKLAFDHISPMLQSVVTSRFSGISAIQKGIGSNFKHFYHVNDAWFADFDSDAPILLGAEEWGNEFTGRHPNPDAFTQITAA